MLMGNQKINTRKISNLSVLKVLHLTLSKLPFEAMVSGEKKIEYRAPSKWILSRLKEKNYDLIKFVNGYGNEKPYFISKYNGFEIEKIPKTIKYTNGLVVDCKIGTIKIYLGEIIEIGNI
jgi:hypothetical protein